MAARSTPHFKIFPQTYVFEQQAERTGGETPPPQGFSSLRYLPLTPTNSIGSRIKQTACCTWKITVIKAVINFRIKSYA